MPNDCFSDHLVPDERRAAAYEHESPERRARLKKLIAQHYAHAARNQAVELERRVRYRMGFESVVRERAVESVLAVFSDASVSPARLLAALLPAVSVGVPEIAVVFSGRVEAFPPETLVAMELAGFDLGLAVAAEGLAPFLAEFMRRNVIGRLLDLGESTPRIDVIPHGWRVWRSACRDGGRTPRLGVWSEDGVEEFDLDVMAWAQAGARLEGWNASVPASFASRSGPFESFLGESYDAIMVPRSRLREAVGYAPLILGPGQEATWIWPELTPCFFMDRSVRWSDDRTDSGRRAPL